MSDKVKIAIVTTIGTILVTLFTIWINQSKPTPPPPKHDLESAHVKDFTSYKDWASGQIQGLDKRLRANETYIITKEAEGVARDRFQAQIEEIRLASETANGINTAFSRDYYAPQKIWIITNNETGKQYWEDSEKNRFRVSWNWTNNVKKYYYIDRDGKNEWCK